MIQLFMKRSGSPAIVPLHFPASHDAIELFGKPALFTNARVDTHTVPDGWHVYDLRGSDNDPGSPCTLEILVVVNHAGSIVVPEPISFPDNQD